MLLEQLFLPSATGTGFEVSGGRRPGYGPFAISLDGQELFNGNPIPVSSPVKNTLAFVSGLSNEQHTLVLTNTGGMPVDIDAIMFETMIGSAGCVFLPDTTLSKCSSPYHHHSVNFDMTTIDDNDTRITYLPQNAWGASSGPEFQNGTMQYVFSPRPSMASTEFDVEALHKHPMPVLRSSLQGTQSHTMVLYHPTMPTFPLQSMAQL